jgi:outer membrane protein assembly factor BamB
VVFGAMDGKLYLISRTNGEEIASYEIGEAISSTPAIVGNKIIVGCEDGNVYAFDTKGKK